MATAIKQKIVPCIWLDNQAEEAAEFYTNLFNGGKIGRVLRYSEAGQEIHGQKPGSAMTAELEIEGFQFMLLNGGPIFKPNPSISFIVRCAEKDEINRLWEKLSDGGEALMPLQKYPFSELYGWVSDKYGVSWQLMLDTDRTEQKISPSLLFVGKVCGKAEEAINFYVSVFKKFKVGDIARYPAGMEPDKEGSVMYSDFILEGQSFSAMDSAREHKFGFSEGISLIVNCGTQEEIDYYWEKLTAVRESEQCGWLKDKYGVSWQITPPVLDDMIENHQSENAKRAMNAMLKMKKLDIAELKRAYEGK
jgi:predicted 3-demethylubiquinone-9 3-methyltransferase (glyoxalase superfamily)